MSTIPSETPKPCPVCAADRTAHFATARDLEYATSADAFEYRCCSACGTIFLVDPPVDRLREIYPPNYYSYQVEDGQKSSIVAVKEWLDRRLFHQLLSGLPGDELSVLDVGGGSGWLLDVVRRVSPRVRRTVEVDLDEAAGDRARAAGHQFHGCRIEDYRPDRPFDLVIMLNLIEHVASPRDVLTAARSMLAPGGLILLKTPNVDTLDRRLFGADWGGLHCPRHWVLFNRAGLLRLGEQCGLACHWARYTQGGPQWTTSLLGALSRRGWVQITADRPMWRHPLYMPLQAATAALDFARLPFVPTAQMLVVFRRDDAPQT